MFNIKSKVGSFFVEAQLRIPKQGSKNNNKQHGSYRNTDV